MTGRVGVGRGRVALGLLGALLVIGGCAAGLGEPSPESVPRPEWTVGDRWVFHRTSVAGETAVVTHVVTEATPGGYTLRIGGLSQPATRHVTADLHLSHQTVAGRVVSRFEPPAMYFAWPLTLDKAWRQDLEYRDGQRDGRYANAWRVGSGVERLHVLAGSFYTVRIERRGGQAERLETYWYSPLVRYWVRFESHAGGYTEELVEYRLSPS